MTTINEELQKLWDHNKAFFGVQPRKIQVQRAGGFYKVRYEGQHDSCFVEDPKHAAKRLQVFDTIRAGLHRKYEVQQ